MCKAQTNFMDVSEAPKVLMVGNPEHTPFSPEAPMRRVVKIQADGQVWTGYLYQGNAV